MWRREEERFPKTLRDIQVLVDSSGPQNTISIHVPDSQEGCCLLVSRNITQSEWALIDSHSTSIIPKTGRFLTMHKRRRKRLTTRSLSQDPALLDDIHHGQVECVLERVWKWPFNAFTLDNATGGRSLPVLCVHLFHWYGLMEHFNLDVVRVWKLFSLIEEGYHGTNPYHNSIHATDIKRHLTHLEIMASLLAAVAHDLDHPGVNQPFLIATSNHLAALYENTSVLENHHWRSAVGCLLESNVAEQLGSIRPELEQQISSLILATDITRQQEFLTRFKAYLDSGSLDLSKTEDRHFILQIALKCADISNPCRPWDVSKKWSQKVCEEFFRQGDYERQLNLPVTSLCDRHSTSIPKIQTGFFKFVVSPLFEEWHRFLDTKLSTSMMGHLRGNQAKWEGLLAAELAEETKTEISDAEEINLEECCDSDRRASLPAVMLETVDRLGRRHSVPINFAGNEINVGIGRRESLPGSERPRRFVGVQERHLEEEEEDEEEFNMSLRSSCSSGIQKSSECGSADDRPVSAENLLPEPSIASITTHDEASRLSSVLHGSSCLTLPANRMLTRQQTFPPLQPYVRQRYMSTTGQELGNPALSNDSTSSDVSSSDSISPMPPPSGSGGSNSSVAPPSGGSNSSVAPPSGGSNSPVAPPSGGSSSPGPAVAVSGGRIKRDASSEATSAGFPSKVARMWREKENVAPSTTRPPELLVSGETPLVKRNSLTIPQVSTRRRGSAPVGQDSILKNLIERQSRRGSVPSEVSVKPPASASSQQCSVLNPLDSNGSLGLPRRSSLPYDLVKHSLSPTSIGYSGERRSSDGGGVTRGSKRRMNKLLKRRSSGGPDLILPSSPSSPHSIIPRRGSLPLDVIASSLYSGTT
ncbi:hypothetical protein M8J75_005645 [Diaphorina citri]|nr:hypothetical protein M8J75_005645 [Diaphorina citri]